MSGYPNQPPQIWHNLSTAPGQYPAPGQFVPPGQYPPPGQYAPPAQFPPQHIPGQYAPAQAYAPPAGFSYPYPTATPGQPTTAPTPTAPSFSYPIGSMPHQTPVNMPQVDWVPTTPQQAIGLSDRAVVAGYEGYDGSPLWVIRARYEGDVIPGKLAIKHQSAYVAWGGKENPVQQIEVCCAQPNRVRWVETRDGVIPPNAVVGGNTSSGETLYIGRAKEQGSLSPGKVHPSHHVMYISFAGKEIAHKIYETLCYV